MAKRFIVVVGILALTSAVVIGQSTNPLVGVWKLLEVDGKPVTGESIFIFTPKYFSRMFTLEQTRPPFKVAAKPTTEEIVAAYNTFTANSGTYEVSGGAFLVNVAVAKNPGNRGPSTQKRPFKVDVKILTFTETVQGQTRTWKLAKLE